MLANNVRVCVRACVRVCEEISKVGAITEQGESAKWGYYSARVLLGLFKANRKTQHTFSKLHYSFKKASLKHQKSMLNPPLSSRSVYSHTMKSLVF